MHGARISSGQKHFRLGGGGGRVGGRESSGGVG